MKELPNRGYLKVKVLADFFSVTEMTIWRWVKSKRFPQQYYLSDGVSRFKTTEVEEWLKQRKARREYGAADKVANVIKQKANKVSKVAERAE